MKLGKRGLEMFRGKAERLARDGVQASQLMDAAVAKAQKSREAFEGLRGQFQTLMRLLRAAIKGDYKDIPWTSIVTGLAAVVYFVNPLDLVPDFIAGIGLLDDITVIAFALNALKGDLAKFETWERENV